MMKGGYYNQPAAYIGSMANPLAVAQVESAVLAERERRANMAKNPVSAGEMIAVPEGHDPNSFASGYLRACAQIAAQIREGK